MFALIAVIVKEETCVFWPLTWTLSRLKACPARLILA